VTVDDKEALVNMGIGLFEYIGIAKGLFALGKTAFRSAIARSSIAIEKLTASRAANARLTSGNSLPVRIPDTGVARFDEFAVGTKNYERWVRNIERRGFTVEERALLQGTAAEIDVSARTLTLDPAQFRFIDQLHESRHILQIVKA